MWGRRGIRRRGLAPLLGLVALAIQSLMPLAHAVAMASAMQGADPNTIVICTAEGPKQVRLGPDGSVKPVDDSGKLPPACPGCPVGAAPAALLPVSATIGPVIQTEAAVAVRIDPAASPSSPRYPPSHPRAPPLSV